MGNQAFNHTHTNRKKLKFFSFFTLVSPFKKVIEKDQIIYIFKINNGNYIHNN